MADSFLVIKLGQRLERLRKRKEKRAVRCGEIPRNKKDKGDKEVNLRERLMVAILIYIDIKKKRKDTQIRTYEPSL